MDLSVIVVNWNAKKLLKDCLISVYEETRNLDFEIFVVDNASTDSSSKMIREEFPQVKLIENQENVGFAKANNQAIRQAKGKYLLLLNPDTVVLSKAIEKMVNFAKRYDDIGILGPKVIGPKVIGPKVIDDRESIQPSCWKFHSIFNVLWENILFNKLAGGYFYRGFHYDKIKKVDVVSGGCFLIRRKAVEDIGLMDESFFMYCEEDDWCYRAKQEGWKIVFYPKATIFHKVGQSSKYVFGKALIEWYRSRTRIFKKHFNKGKSTIMQILLSLGLILRLSVSFFLWSIERTKQHTSELQAYWDTVKWYFKSRGKCDK